MIPDFLLKVTQAKVAAGMGKSSHDFQSAASKQSMLTFGTVQGRSTSSASANVSPCNIVSNTDKEVKIIESRGKQVKEPTANPAIRSTKNGDMLCTVLSRKQSCEEIQVPPPLKPKPRVKKVMRGGSLVTIPPPQPRRQESVKDGGKSTFSDTNVCLMSSLEGRDAACDVCERSIQEIVENPSFKETHDDQELAKKEGSINSGFEADNLETKVSSRDNRGSGTEVLTEDCEVKQVPLTHCDTAVSEKSHNTSYGNSNDNFNESDSNTCPSATPKADESINLLSEVPEVILDKGSEKVSNKEHQGEFTSGPKSDSYGKAAIAKDSEVNSEDLRLSENLERALCDDLDGMPPVLDPEEMTIFKDPLEKTKTEPRPQGIVIVDPQLITMDSPIIMEKSADLPHKLVAQSSIMKQTLANNKEGQSAREPSEKNTSGSNPSEKLVNDKEDRHLNDFGDKDNESNCYNDEQNVPANSTEEITETNTKGCDDTAVNDNDDKRSDCVSSSSTDDKEDNGNDSDEVDDDSDNDDDDNDVYVKDNQVDDTSEEYAELIMDDSTSEGEDEYDVYPVNDSDSDEKEDELKSDYEAEDMNLDSDTESATGGITSYQDTTIGARVKQSRRKLQREKRKAKNQRKKASKKRAKAAKQVAKGHVQNRSHDPAGTKKDFKGTQKLTLTSQKAGTKLEPGTGDKSTEAVLKSKPGALKLPPNNPPKEGTLEDGSLLSMVSSFAVDLTVAANEKLFLKKRRGGQHSKKMKKAKRKAEALERIRRGEPPPRAARRVFVELPKPICAFYREGKCRKGSDCSFRHDRSALIKRKEICRFYMHAADNCFAGEDCIFMHSSFPCKFFHTSRCRDGDHCRFSHDALTEETDRLLQAFLNPPTENPVQSSQEKNLTTSNQQSAGGNSRDDDPSQTLTSSSPYNLRASARKRALGSDEAGAEGGSLIGGKIAGQETPGNDQDNKEGQSCAFLPGLYRDLSS